MDLSLECGEPDFRKIMALPAWMIDLWQARYLLDPWGEQRADLRMAFLTTAVHNYMGGGKDGYKFILHDFMPYSDKPAPPTVEELQAKLMDRLGMNADGSLKERAEPKQWKEPL